MAKYILREEVLSHPFANGKYDHKNADINFILGHESYEEWLETLPIFTEQDIVKSVLEKIRAEIAEVYINITYQENRKATWGLRKAMQITDKYISKSENKNEDNN